MEEQNQPNALEAQWGFLGSTNDSYCLAGPELNKQYMAGVGIDGIHYLPVPSPQWIHNQQTPQNYVEYLAENVVSEVQVDASAEASDFTLVDGSADMIVQETWEPTGDVRHASGHCSEALAAGSSYPSKSSRKSRAALSDRCRKMRIAERIDTFRELFPCSKQGGRASLMDDVINHIKNLQFQIKDLSRSRFGGEPSSIPFLFVEGCGHYILDEQLIEPLEETCASCWK